MKKNLLISLKLSLMMLLLCSLLYPLLIAAVGKATPGDGDGETVVVNGKIVGYANIGQKFTEDRYFWGRPSAVDYNAAGSAGSNKGPTNADYLQTVQTRIDSFLAHNPTVKKEQIPAEIVTASGSGLDPNISPVAARLQIERVAKARGLNTLSIQALVDNSVEKHLLGPDVINVLRLNVAVDEMSRTATSKNAQ